MNKASVRDLHLKTSTILGDVARGRVYIIEKRGVPVAELRPYATPGVRPRLPDREAFIAKLPRVRTDSGRILEQDRS